MMRFLSVVVLGLVACEEAPPIRRPEPGQPGCEPACLALARLDCPEAQVTKAGTSCIEMCDRVIRSGLSEIETECISASESVAQVRLCHGVRCLR